MTDKKPKTRGRGRPRKNQNLTENQNLFGFEIGSEEQKRLEQEQLRKSFAIPQNDDGAITIQSGSYFGHYVDLDGTVRNEVELITKYREMSMQHELETAIDEVVNEAIVADDKGEVLQINTDELTKVPPQIKKKIQDEFHNVLRLLNFGNMGAEIFRRWYIDGRLHYHIILKDDIQEGIQELRYIDPRRIRKIREVQKVRDPKTGIDVVSRQQEYYLYNERGTIGMHAAIGAKISVDSIVTVNSGLMNPSRTMVLSHLHKSIKPLNCLRMVEDATVIYRLSRAPERRVFYVDVGQMPTVKAEQYLKDIMTKYRNKLVYDSSTGEIKDDRKFMAMLEDFWLPRREGSKGTEITTLQGGMNLGELEDVKYFEKKLYKSLGIPISRLEPQQGFSLGRTTEVTRDEIKFSKFVEKLRSKFSSLFDDLMKIQLVAKKICTEDEWQDFKEEIWYEFKKDNNFNELKEAELLNNRLAVLTIVDPYVGKYFSQEWVKRNVLHQSDEEIEEITNQMAEEAEALAAQIPTDEMGNPLPVDQNGTPLPAPPQPPTMGHPPLPGQPAQPQPPGLPSPQAKTSSTSGGSSNPLANPRQNRFKNDSLERKAG